MREEEGAADSLAHDGRELLLVLLNAFLVGLHFLRHAGVEGGLVAFLRE